MNVDTPEATRQPAADKAARQRLISRSIWLTVPGTFVLIGGAYGLLPPPRGMEETGARLVLAVRWLPIAMLPYAAVCLDILAVRFLEGAHNPLLSSESERLRIRCRVMQNTLEQLVWFAICVLALANYLAPAQTHLIPIVCTFFCIARFVYWRGYLRHGTLGRAPGVQLTFTLNISLLVAVLVHFAQDLAAR